MKRWTGADPTANQDTPDSRPDKGLADNTDTGGAADPKGEDLKDGVDGEDRSFHTSTARSGRGVSSGCRLQNVPPRP